MKRTVSLILALILALSCCICASAAEDDCRDPAVCPVDPVINPKLDPALHPKLTPALIEAVNAEAPPDTEAVLSTKITVYFNTEFDTVADMPSWPDYTANNEYSEYVSGRNKQLAMEAFNVSSLYSVHYIDYYIPGCMIIYDVTLDALMLCERSELIKRVDIFDPSAQSGKQDCYTIIAKNVFPADAYIPVLVGNSAHMKSVEDMPSWPTERNTDVEETQKQIERAREEYSAYVKEFNDRFVAEAFDGVDAAVFAGYGFMVLAAVMISELDTLASRDCVRYIEYSENQIAESDIEEPDKPDMSYYQSKLCGQYGITDLEALDYEEMYYHGYDPGDSESTCDWVLVRAFRFDLCYPQALHSAVVGGRRLTASSLGWKPFEFAFGIYDADKDRFFDLTEIDFSRYNGLYAVWKNLDLTVHGGTIYENSRYFDGDADGDGVVTVMDATKIQRVLAGVSPMDEIVAASADVDKDGEVSIFDATRIQRYKAELCQLDGSC